MSVISGHEFPTYHKLFSESGRLFWGDAFWRPGRFQNFPSGSRAVRARGVRPRCTSGESGKSRPQSPASTDERAPESRSCTKYHKNFSYHVAVFETGHIFPREMFWGNPRNPNRIGVHGQAYVRDCRQTSVGFPATHTDTDYGWGDGGILRRSMLSRTHKSLIVKSFYPFSGSEVSFRLLP
jgi:hypothetical protein